MYRKSLRAIRKERKAQKCAAMRAAKERKRIANAIAAPIFCGVVRGVGPAFGGARQVVIKSDGLAVWVGTSRARTYRAFCAAMNRKLWRLVCK